MNQVLNLGNLNVNFVKLVIKSLNYYVTIILCNHEFFSLILKGKINHKSMTFEKQKCYISKINLITQYQKYNIYELMNIKNEFVIKNN